MSKLSQLASAILLLSTGLWGQSRANITGTVTDATGAVIPNVSVTATNKLTGIKTATKSNDAGIFTLAQLNDGTYSVTAEAAGFALATTRRPRRHDLLHAHVPPELAQRVPLGIRLKQQSD